MRKTADVSQGRKYTLCVLGWTNHDSAQATFQWESDWLVCSSSAYRHLWRVWGRAVSEAECSLVLRQRQPYTVPTRKWMISQSVFYRDVTPASTSPSLSQWSCVRCSQSSRELTDRPAQAWIGSNVQFQSIVSPHLCPDREPRRRLLPQSHFLWAQHSYRHQMQHTRWCMKLHSQMLSAVWNNIHTVNVSWRCNTTLKVWKDKHQTGSLCIVANVVWQRMFKNLLRLSFYCTVKTRHNLLSTRQKNDGVSMRRHCMSVLDAQTSPFITEYRGSEIIYTDRVEYA